MGFLMAARSIQISMDEALLAALDADPETQEVGRSAMIRRALTFYMRMREQAAIDAAYDAAYAGGGDDVWVEMKPLLQGQRWPDK
jgi:hypothetical protein